jgi:hypothetical protein
MTDDKPLITHLFTADPSAHVLMEKYTSIPHTTSQPTSKTMTTAINTPMEDYHVFSLSKIGGPVTDHGTVLSASSVPWVSKQMWAPDAAFKNGIYYLYFPTRDHEGIFRIGAATSSKPEGQRKSQFQEASPLTLQVSSTMTGRRICISGGFVVDSCNAGIKGSIEQKTTRLTERRSPK